MIFGCFKLSLMRPAKMLVVVSRESRQSDQLELVKEVSSACREAREHDCWPISAPPDSWVLKYELS